MPAPIYNHRLIIAVKEFLDHVRVPVINLHPDLPGVFSGKNAILRAWNAFQYDDITHTDVMIHHVVPEVDVNEVIY